jgi:hypothetical protein
LLGVPITLHTHGAGWESVEIEKGVREEVKDGTPGGVVVVIVCDMRGTVSWSICAKSVGIYLCENVLCFLCVNLLGVCVEADGGCDG